MKLVCLTGIDGTGKTTLARSAVEALRRQDVAAAYLYGRTYPALSRALMSLGRLTLLRRTDLWRDYGGYTARKKETMRNPLLAAIYTAAILLDYYAQIWLKLLPHLWSRRVVICDRYVYDTVISDLAVHLSYSPAGTDRAIRWGLAFLPRPLLTVLVDVPPEVAFARKDDVPHVDYLSERRDWYLRLAHRPEVWQLDGEEQPATLVRSLLRQIAARRNVAAIERATRIW